MTSRRVGVIHADGRRDKLVPISSCWLFVCLQYNAATTGLV